MLLPLLRLNRMELGALLRSPSSNIWLSLLLFLHYRCAIGLLQAGVCHIPFLPNTVTLGSTLILCLRRICSTLSFDDEALDWGLHSTSFADNQKQNGRNILRTVWSGLRRVCRTLPWPFGVG